MTYTIALTDEQYARLQAVVQTNDNMPDTVLADLLNWLPTARTTITTEDYDARWQASWQVVGSIEQGQPLTNEQIEELIGEDRAEDHAGHANA